MPTVSVMILDVQITAIFATIAVSLLSLVGGLVLFRSKKAYTKYIPYLVSFAAGVMLAATFFDILPEAFEHPSVSLILTTIFTGIVFSPSSSLRQFSSRYAFRAGPNLRAKEFRYLRHYAPYIAIWVGLYHPPFILGGPTCSL